MYSIKKFAKGTKPVRFIAFISSSARHPIVLQCLTACCLLPAACCLLPAACCLPACQLCCVCTNYYIKENSLSVSFVCCTTSISYLTYTVDLHCHHAYIHVLTYFFYRYTAQTCRIISTLWTHIHTFCSAPKHRAKSPV